jgi:hypothetical protein
MNTGHGFCAGIRASEIVRIPVYLYSPGKGAQGAQGARKAQPLDLPSCAVVNAFRL